MAAESPDDPMAPIVAAAASVVPGPAASKPNRPSPVGKGRSGTKAAGPRYTPSFPAATSEPLEPPAAMSAAPGDAEAAAPVGFAEVPQHDAERSAMEDPLAVEAAPAEPDAEAAAEAVAQPATELPATELPATEQPTVDQPIPAVAFAVAPVPAETPAETTAGPGAVPTPTRVYHNKSLEIAMTTTHDFLALGQANVEAVIKSSQIWTTGVQDIGRTIAESAQAQFDHSVGTWKALAGTKSLKEAFDIQSTRARAALEKAVADSSKLTDASLKLAEQALAPITARITVATETFSKPV